MKNVCIVIPAYNEGSRLSVSAFHQCLSQNQNISFLLVDDGSTDSTYEKFLDIQKKDPAQIELLKLEHNSGKAEAVRQGILLGSKKAEFVGFWDADLATPLWEINNFLAEFQIRQNLDICCGCRLKRAGANITRKASRHYISRIVTSLISILLHMHFYDTQCGAKIFRSKSVPELFSRPFLTRWFFDVEIFKRYISVHGKEDAFNNILEYPLHRWDEIAGSKLSWKTSFQIFKELFMIAVKY